MLLTDANYDYSARATADAIAQIARIRAGALDTFAACRTHAVCDDFHRRSGGSLHQREAVYAAETLEAHLAAAVADEYVLPDEQVAVAWGLAQHYGHLWSWGFDSHPTAITLTVIRARIPDWTSGPGGIDAPSLDYRTGDLTHTTYSERLTWWVEPAGGLRIEVSRPRAIAGRPGPVLRWHSGGPYDTEPVVEDHGRYRHDEGRTCARHVGALAEAVRAAGYGEWLVSAAFCALEASAAPDPEPGWLALVAAPTGPQPDDLTDITDR